VPAVRPGKFNLTRFFFRSRPLFHHQGHQIFDTAEGVLQPAHEFSRKGVLVGDRYKVCLPASKTLLGGGLWFFPTCSEGFLLQ